MSDEEAATVILGYRTRAGWQDVQGLARVSQVPVKRSRAEIKKFQVRRALKQGHQEGKICHYLHCELHTIKSWGWIFSSPERRPESSWASGGTKTPPLQECAFWWTQPGR